MRCQTLVVGRTRLAPRALMGISGGETKPVKKFAAKPVAVPKPHYDHYDHVEFGKDWYEETRELGKLKGSHGFRTKHEELMYHRAANVAANHGLERKDLYTTNWDGADYKGSPWNVATLIAALAFFTPLIGLVFAYMTYGTMWGNLTPL